MEETEKRMKKKKNTKLTITQWHHHHNHQNQQQMLFGGVLVSVPAKEKCKRTPPTHDNNNKCVFLMLMRNRFNDMTQTQQTITLTQTWTHMYIQQIENGKKKNIIFLPNSIDHVIMSISQGHHNQYEHVQPLQVIIKQSFKLKTSYKQHQRKCQL